MNNNTFSTIGNIVAGAGVVAAAVKTPKHKPSYKVEVSDINAFAKHVEGTAKTSGKPYNGYFVKVHLNDTFSGDFYIDNRFVWLDKDEVDGELILSGKATIVLPQHFTYNVNTYNVKTGEKGKAVIDSTTIANLLNDKENFIKKTKLNQVAKKYAYADTDSQHIIN